MEFGGTGMEALDIEAVRPDVPMEYATASQGGNVLMQQLVAHRTEPDPSTWNIEQIGNALCQELGRRGKGVADMRGRRQSGSSGGRENSMNPEQDDSFQQMRAELEEVAKQWLSEIQISEFWQSDCKYAGVSLKIDFGTENGADAVNAPETSNPTTSEELRLPLFGSLLAPKKPGSENIDEFVSHVGGSVWCLDWCPQRPGWKIWPNYDKEYLAVGAHPASGRFQRRFGEPVSEYHKLGEPLSGKALVQIWSYNFTSEMDTVSNEGTQDSDCTEPDQTGIHETLLEEAENMGAEMSYDGDAGRGRGRGRARGRRGRGGRGPRGGIPGGTPRVKDKTRTKRLGKGRSKDFELPKMVLAIAHDGGVTWDAKWQPAEGRSVIPTFQDREFLRLGFLAVALGDGSVQVYDVPLPKIFEFAKGAPLVAAMAPVFKCTDLRSGGQKSIPLTIEWATSEPHDLLLAGCHDGTVALWKFTPSSSGQETRPLLFFIADSFALRTIAWAPSNCGIEGEHIVATGGHSGHLKFWDLRDPFRPLWELRLSRGQVLSMDWLESPRCILVTLDDGTLRTISLNNALSDTPVTGKPFTGTQAQGVQSYYCSSFAIWNIEVCRNTGFVAYCSADGSVIHFELSEKAIEKGGTRYREPHYLCGAFAVNKDKKTVVIVSQDCQGPVQMKRSLTEWSFTPRSKRGFTVSVNQEMRASSIAAGLLPPTADSPSKKRVKRGRKKSGAANEAVEESEGFPVEVDEGTQGQSGALASCKEEIMEGATDTSGKAVQPPNTVEEMPSKLLAVHRVKWNPNKSSSGWVCYGGAAGLVRCRFVSMSSY